MGVLVIVRGLIKMQLSFEGVSKSFGDLKVVNDFSLHVASGELVALVGPSGCGKSTLLHMAAGLELATSGQVLANQNPIAEPDPKRTLMFQENALYPWLTLVQNVAMALELQKVKRAQALEQATGWLHKVQLQGFENYYPHQVSGGMRQRCALARAFITSPPVLLLDEPFGALDALTRLTLQDTLLGLIQETSPTVLLVTHDVNEALYLANRIVVFSPRPASVMQEFNISNCNKTHDLSELSDVRSQILKLLGVGVSESIYSSNKFKEMAA